MAVWIPKLAAAVIAQTPEAPAQDKGMVAFVLAMLLIGVAVVGVILLVLVVLWGGRTRRITREELPEVRVPDPFEAMRAETRRNAASEKQSTDDADASSRDSGESGDADDK